ncbi:hypothetical protein E2562_001992 [Oryza meyeriana var. granulata]|uniref:Uncharacterized protein n=1 Tax=Oryza meyeriana var. granulata TaxID=110450 RepID=A0A6G1C4F5_9ORYZ|nr:hypothetical protein E2562_001992 [Oryza meyeriana var. granulata]
MWFALMHRQKHALLPAPRRVLLGRGVVRAAVDGEVSLSPPPPPLATLLVVVLVASSLLWIFLPPTCEEGGEEIQLDEWAAEHGSQRR